MLFNPCRPELTEEKFSKMTEREQVIEIERNENVAIDVGNSPAVAETVVEENVFVGWKRIIIGASLISFMVLPLLGGTLVSYFLRKDLHEPVDPYNVWPNTRYKDQEHPEYVAEDIDLGYSERPNHYLLIKNGDQKCFTVPNSTNADAYMAVYMLENLNTFTDRYTIHVVTSTRKSNLSPVHDMTFVGHHRYLEFHKKMKKEPNDDMEAHEYYDPQSACLAARVAEKFPKSLSTKSTDQKEIMKSIAEEINKAIRANPKAFYYPSSDKKGSYIFSYYGDGAMRLGLFEELKNLRYKKLMEARNAAAAKAKKSDSSDKKDKKVEKPKYNKIVMASLKELSA